MNADAPVGDATRIAPPSTPTLAHLFADGASVVLLRPWKLRGTVGVVRRRMTHGWEVEIRSPEGTPMHLTLPEKALYLR